MTAPSTCPLPSPVFGFPRLGFHFLLPRSHDRSFDFLECLEHVGQNEDAVGLLSAAEMLVHTFMPWCVTSVPALATCGTCDTWTRLGAPGGQHGHVFAPIESVPGQGLIRTRPDLLSPRLEFRKSWTSKLHTITTLARIFNPRASFLKPYMFIKRVVEISILRVVFLAFAFHRPMGRTSRDLKSDL